MRLPAPTKARWLFPAAGLVLEGRCEQLPELVIQLPPGAASDDQLGTVLYDLGAFQGHVTMDEIIFNLQHHLSSVDGQELELYGLS